MIVRYQALQQWRVCRLFVGPGAADVTHGGQLHGYHKHDHEGQKHAHCAHVSGDRTLEQ